MKAVKYQRIRHAEVVEADTPEIKPGDLLIGVHATGICASDVASYQGNHPYRVPPVISGHESAGQVVSIGEGVKNFQVGDRIVIEPQIGCGVCRLCIDGDYNICKQKRLMGTPAWAGGFAQYISVPEPCAYKIPDNMPYAEATLIEPLSVAIHAIARAGVKAGESVAILGTGAIGLMLVLTSIYKKAGKVICSDIKKKKLEFARLLGATDILNPNHLNVTDEILKLTDGIGVDTTFVTVGTDEIMDTALNLTRPKGKVIAVANFSPQTQIPMPRVQLQEREIIGTAMYTKSDYLSAIKMMPDVLKQLTGFITHRIGMIELPAMIDSLADRKINDAVKIIVDMA